LSVSPHRHWRTLLALLLTLVTGLIQAQPLLLTELPTESLGTWADLLVEDGPPLSLEEAQARQREGLFRKGSHPVLTYGIGARPCWVHLELFNPTTELLPFKMVVGTTWTDRLDMYVVHDNRVSASWQTGDDYPNAQGLIPAVGFTFSPRFAPGRSDLYLRVESIDPLVLPIELMTEERALSNERLVHYSYGLLYGYLIALIAYNIMLFAGLRERSYLYYSFYLASFILLNVAYTGHGSAWLWPGQPLLQRYMIYVMMLLYCCCGLLFASRFLALKEHAPRVLRLMRLSALSGVGLMVLFIMMGSQLGAALLAFSVVSLFTPGMVLLGIFTVSHGLVAGRYFLMATIFGMLGASSTSLAVWGWLPFNSLTYHGVDYGIVIEATLLALALAHRFNEMNAKLFKVTVSHDVLSAEVAERKQAEEMLRKSEESLNESQMIAGLGSYVLDIPTGLWKSSDALDKLLGIDKTYEHSVDGWEALIHPDDRTMMSEYFANEVLAQSKPFDKEYRIIRHDDQTERWVHGLGKLQFDAQGHPLKMHGTIQDLTERKKAEQKTDDLNRLNEAIVGRSPSGIAVYKATGPCVMVNEAYARSFGGTVIGILKQDFRNSASWKRDGLLDCANQALETGLTIRHDVEGITTFGREVVLECIFAPINIAGIPHLLVITNDILARIEAERALTESMRKLEEKELAKTRFLAAAGHDLRQPLAAANLFIDALKFTEPTPDQNEIIQRLDQTMGNFNGLLDALLNVSKLDAGMVKPEYTSIKVAEVFNWIEQSFAPMASEKQIGFKLNFPIKGTLAIRSDIGLLKSVLMNLVSNAIKFTPQGAILVSARRRGGDVLFQVWDTGIGIGKEQLERIYDEFYQINNQQRDRTRGLGLGLSIAKRALALLDREITCRSQPGRGSVFEFRLPSDGISNPVMAHTAEAPQEDMGSYSFARGKRFVVVEDDALVAEALNKSLGGMGGKVECFHSAEYALQYEDIESTDCYIVDYMLGGKFDGIQFLNLLRQKLGKPVKAVIMTGDTSTAFVREAADCEWPVLHKPVNTSKLIARLSEQYGRNAE
jgi:PAS domain S-box-containing protein